MKKIFLTVLAFILCSTFVFASDIEVLPTMRTKSSAQDRVWVGTFQIVWNDFMDKIIHNPIRFREGTPEYVKDLNKQRFTIASLSEESYYRYTGKVTKKTKKQITKAIRKKFDETSDLLDKLDLTPGNDKLLIYAMLKKDFEFVNAFDKLGKLDFGKNQSAEYFGVEPKSEDKLGEGIKILFYNSPEDFAVILTTKGKDEVYLYKNASNKPFNYIYADMFKKQKYYKESTEFAKNDELRVPNIKFFEEKSFEELTGKRIMGTNLVIDQAMETIKFNMDNKGVELKSEAAITVMTTALLPENEPRKFYFDDTFVLFLKETGKNKPYFALRVNDIEKFQK